MIHTSNWATTITFRHLTRNESASNNTPYQMFQIQSFRAFIVENFSLMKQSPSWGIVNFATPSLDRPSSNVTCAVCARNIDIRTRVRWEVIFEHTPKTDLTSVSSASIGPMNAPTSKRTWSAAIQWRRKLIYLLFVTLTFFYGGASF